MSQVTKCHTFHVVAKLLFRLAVSVGVCWHVMFPGDALGVSGGCLGECLGASEWCYWKSEAIGCTWGVSGFSVLATWSQNTNLANS